MNNNIQATIDLTLPLMGNDAAYLRVPYPLSVDNYDYLLEQIKMLRKGIAYQSAVAPIVVEANEEITLSMRHALLRMGLTPAVIAGLSGLEARTLIAKGQANG